MKVLGLKRGDELFRRLANWACASVLALCLSIALGWLLRSPALQLHALYVGPPMSFPVALALAAAATALLLQNRWVHPPARAWSLRGVGCALALLGLLYTFEDFTRKNLGIDFQPFHAHRSLLSGYSERLSPNASAAMLLLGLALFTLSLRPRPRTQLGVLVLGGSVSAIGVVGVCVYALALPFFNVWKDQNSLAAPTAAAYVLLGGSVLVAARDWASDPRAQLSDFQRLTATALSVLVIVSLVIGLSGLAVMQRQTQRVEERAMRAALLERSQGARQVIERALALAGERARELALAARGSALPQAAYAAVARELHEHAGVWTDATAIAYRSPPGMLEARVGTFAQEPALSLRLSSSEPAHAVLLAGVEPVLQTTWTLHSQDIDAGQVRMQQPMPVLAALLSMPLPWKYTGMALCATASGDCFAVQGGRFIPLAQTSARNLRAQWNKVPFDTVVLGHGARGRPCLLTQEALAGTGLELGMSVPAYEVYAPVRVALRQLALIVLGCILAGAWVMRQRLYGITQSLAEALERSGAHYRHFLAAANSAQDALCLLEPVRDGTGSVLDFRVRFGNAAFARRFRRSTAAVVGALLSDLLEGKPELDPYFAGCLHVWESSQAQTVECVLHPRGETQEAWSHMLCHLTRSADGVFVVARDVSADRRHVAQLTALAMTDSLTGLANRRAFEVALAGACERLGDAGRGLAVVFCDIDDFKMLNDAQGHAYGDEVLIWLAQTLKSAVRRSDLVARLAGDEFVVLLENVQSPEEVRQVVDMLRAQLDRAVPVRGSLQPLQVSVGFAMSFEADAQPGDVLARADAAMYTEKERRRRERRSMAMSSR